MNASSSPLTGPFSDRYTIERQLGSGATSLVYLAHDSVGARRVAIKVLRRELAESISVDRFLREIRVMGELQYPHILPVLDSGERDGRLFCVLPYMDGGTLRDRLDRDKQLPLDEALSIAIAIARALEFAHSRKIIHRDVKPDNVLFSGGVPCLADFGIARAVEHSTDDVSTSTGIVRGTPAYMSPEQAGGERDYDGRTDIYSLGIVLYEMVAGVPAFVGPTPQSVLAQRLTHMPQPIRVYRPRTPSALQRIIEHAVATNVADRFQTAGEFATALETIRAQIVTGTATLDTPTARIGPLLRNPRALAFVAVGASVALLAYALMSRPSGWWSPAVSLDTTRVAVFVADSAENTSTELPAQSLLRAGLRRWQDLTIVPYDESRDAVRRRGATGSSPARAWRDVAADLKAGRYVVGRIVRTPTGRALNAEYRDVASGLLYQIRVDLPADSSRVAPTYSAAIDSLVLRGTSDGSPTPTTDAPRHLFATQAFIAGLRARSEWSLERADSLFSRATQLDPSAARAHLWLAQVRVWRSLRDDQWVNSAERAARDSISLAAVERPLAAALVALSQHRYAQACDQYRSLIAADSGSFAGWYGIGECNRRDIAVVPDARSPSGWRFRSSFNQEIKAYSRAFELLPATYHGFQSGGYSRLRTLLFTSARDLQRGVSADSSRREFLARPRLIGDSIALIPFEQRQILGSDPKAVVSPEAIESLRAMLRQIAERWSAAYPGSPDAKEAIAISLELQGDRTALDSIRAAERLAVLPSQRLRFAATRVILQVKHAVPDNIAGLEAARRTADSLRRAFPNPTPDEAAMLAPIAAVTGHCAEAATLLRRWAKPFSPAVLRDVVIPQDVVSDVYALQAYVAIGCRPPDDMPTARQIADRIAAASSSADKVRNAESYLLTGIVTSEFPRDSAMIVRLATNGGNMLVAEASALANDLGRARSIMDRSAQNRRTSMPGDLTPDAARLEARVWLYARDTAAAIRVLESALGSARRYAPMSVDGADNNVSLFGALGDAMGLLAQLTVDKNPAASRQWARAAATLWAGADESLQIRVRQLTALAGR